MTGMINGYRGLGEKSAIKALMEMMRNMQAHVDKLENACNEKDARIEALQKENDEYKRAINLMRDFTDNEEPQQEEISDMSGHDLLGSHGKILVIGGQELGVNVMNGIAKTMGFEKNDFEYVDYDKAKDFTERIRKSGKYSAVIFGACPHKTTAGAGYSSVIEKFKQIEGMPFATEARSKSGKLKVTKESFRTALSDVCENLKPVYAC